MIGWIYILLSANCSVLIAHFLKVSEKKGLNTVRVLTVNYIVATLIAFSSGFFRGNAHVQFGESSAVIILAAAVGVIFIVNFFIYSKSVHYNGVGISVAAMRISLLIPVLISIFWYFDEVRFMQWIGIFSAIIALFLLLPNKRKMLREPLSVAWLLVLLFLGTGMGDASLMIYEEDFSNLLSKEQFMGFVFLSAFIVGLTVMAFRKNLRINRNEILLGIAIGVPNLYSAIFLIEALPHLSGAVVYSSVNILTVMGATILGILFWGDKLTKIQWVGILFTVVVIILLI